MSSRPPDTPTDRPAAGEPPADPLERPVGELMTPGCIAIS